MYNNLLKEIEDRFNELNSSIDEDFKLPENYYIEVSSSDSKKAMDVAHDNLFIKRALYDNTIVTDGVSIFKSNNIEAIQELYTLFSQWGIHIIDCNIHDLDEESNSSGAGAFLTPNAFGKTASTKSIKSNGMIPLKKTNKIFVPMKETPRLSEGSEYKKIISGLYNLNEGKYQEIKNDPNISIKKKINLAIAEVYTKLYEAERIIIKNSKLKNEVSGDTRLYWKSTSEKLTKLSERLNRLTSSIDALGI